MSNDNRRNFLKTTATLGIGALTGLPLNARPADAEVSAGELDIHIFSKHLQFLDYPAMAAAAAAMSFAGVDLTVRPGGHVLPENVDRDLPRAVRAIKAAGLRSQLMTTAILSADDPLTAGVLRAAANQGIERYRPGWYPFDTALPVLESLEHTRRTAAKLAELNERIGIAGSYQNHAGLSIGANLYEIETILTGLGNEAMGCQYDIRHATVEGGRSWPTGLRLIAPRINTIVLKDFRWEQRDGKWQILNVPIGEGMVDFTAYFRYLKAHQIKVPVSLHCEYDLGGAQHGAREISVVPEVVYAAMRKDLLTIRELWRTA